MDKASTQTTAVVTGIEIAHSDQPWSGATLENVAAIILARRGIRFRPSVAPTLADILPPCRIRRCSRTDDITVWQGPQEITGTIGEPILKPSNLKRAYTQAELDAAVTAERERCAKVAHDALHLPNNGTQFADGWCSASLQIEQAIQHSWKRPQHPMQEPRA